MRFTAFSVEVLGRATSGHLCGSQAFLASRKLPQYFFDRLPLTAIICSVLPEVDGGMKGIYIALHLCLAS